MFTATCTAPPALLRWTVPETPQPIAQRRASWMLLLGILLIAANLRPSITAVGPVLDDIRSSLHLSGAVASVLISIPLLAFGLFSPVAPWISRRLGLNGALAAALGLLAVAIAVRSLPWTPDLWVGTALLGAAIAVMNVVLPSVVKRDFPDRVGQITGVYAAVLSVLAAIAAGVAVPIAGVTHEGWRWSLGVWAGLALVGLAVLAPQLRGPARESAFDPEFEQPVDRAARSYRSPWTSALGWQVTIFMGVQSIVFFTLITWLPSIEQSAGISAATAGFHQFLLNIGSLAGSLLTAAAIHRARDQRGVGVASAVLIGIGVTGELVLPSFGAVWVCVIGLGTGTSLTLALSLFALRAGHHRQATELSGMAQSIGYLMAAAGPIAIGIVHDVTGSWTTALVVILVLTVAQLAASLLAARNRLIG
jgi:CP family cyanate transporter-like MFS transporter